jgi:hypothetical protein
VTALDLAVERGYARLARRASALLAGQGARR